MLSVLQWKNEESQGTELRIQLDKTIVLDEKKKVFLQKVE